MEKTFQIGVVLSLEKIHFLAYSLMYPGTDDSMFSRRQKYFLI